MSSGGRENRRLIKGAGMPPELEAEVISHIRVAERMARRMGRRFVVDPAKIARYGKGPRPSPKETGGG